MAYIYEGISITLDFIYLLNGIKTPNCQNLILLHTLVRFQVILFNKNDIFFTNSYMFTITMLYNHRKNFQFVY